MTDSRTQKRKPSRRQPIRGGRTVGGRGKTRRSHQRKSRLSLGAGSLAAMTGRMRPRFSLLFALALVSGIALAKPLEKQIAQLTSNNFGLLESMAIQGNSRLSFGEIAAITRIQRGTPLATIDTSVIATRLAREAWIREADVLRLPPSTLLIRVEERKPKAILVPRNSSSREQGTRLVDANGHLFIAVAASNSESLPRLVGGEALASEQQHEVLRKGLALIEHLQAPKLADLWDHDLAVYLPIQNETEGWALRGSMDVLLGQKDLKSRIDRLSQLIRNEKIIGALDGQRMLIDLRFANQAVLRRGGKT